MLQARYGVTCGLIDLISGVGLSGCGDGGGWYGGYVLLT